MDPPGLWMNKVRAKGDRILTLPITEISTGWRWPQTATANKNIHYGGTKPTEEFSVTSVFRGDQFKARNIQPRKYETHLKGANSNASSVH